MEPRISAEAMQVGKTYQNDAGKFKVIRIHGVEDDIVYGIAEWADEIGGKFPLHLPVDQQVLEVQ